MEGTNENQVGILDQVSVPLLRLHAAVVLDLCISVVHAVVSVNLCCSVFRFVAFLRLRTFTLSKPPWLQEKLPLNAAGKQVHGKGANWAFTDEEGTLSAAMDDATGLLERVRTLVGAKKEEIIHANAMGELADSWGY